jgi:hypothetical protein
MGWWLILVHSGWMKLPGRMVAARRRVGAAPHDRAASSALHDHATLVKGSTLHCLGRCDPTPPRRRARHYATWAVIARHHLGEGLDAALPGPPSLTMPDAALSRSEPPSTAPPALTTTLTVAHCGLLLGNK